MCLCCLVTPRAARQWNILPSVEFPCHDGIIEMSREALCLGSLAHSHAVRQTHIKVSPHIHTQTHKATTWKELADLANPKVLSCCVSAHRAKHRQIRLHTLVLLLVFSKRSNITWIFTALCYCIFPPLIYLLQITRVPIKNYIHNNKINQKLIQVNLATTAVLQW